MNATLSPAQHAALVTIVRAGRVGAKVHAGSARRLYALGLVKPASTDWNNHNVRATPAGLSYYGQTPEGIAARAARAAAEAAS